MASKLLVLALVLLIIDALIEVGFVGSMVGFAHNRAGKSFEIEWPTGPFQLHGKPANLIVNQGHTSNGAAGTALILVGVLGFVVLFRERSRSRRTSLRPYASRLLLFWIGMTVLSVLLTISALAYTFIVTHQTKGQTIDLALAAANPEPLAYPNDQWTPENWFLAVLDLPLINDSDRRDIRLHVRLMQGWRWNLIPLLILGIFVALLAIKEVLANRRRPRDDPKFEYSSVTQERL